MSCFECIGSNEESFKLEKSYTHKQLSIIQCKRRVWDDSGVNGNVTLSRLKSVSISQALWRSSTEPVIKDNRVFEKAWSPNENLFIEGSSILDYNHGTNS